MINWSRKYTQQRVYCFKTWYKKKQKTKNKSKTNKTKQNSCCIKFNSWTWYVETTPNWPNQLCQFVFSTHPLPCETVFKCRTFLSRERERKKCFKARYILTTLLKGPQYHLDTLPNNDSWTRAHVTSMHTRTRRWLPYEVWRRCRRLLPSVF